MAQTTPSRRALLDLPVNTFGTPSSLTTAGKASMGHKRQIQEVEEPEFPQPTSRVRVSPAGSRNTPRNDAQLAQVSHVSPRSNGALTYNFYQTQPALSGAMSVFPSASHIRADSPSEEPVEEMGEGDSQNSYKGSAVSSVIDFDPDDTMVSQQTAATEVTQPLRSSISQVSQQCLQRSHGLLLNHLQHAETLRLRLRLAHFKVQTNQINLPLSQLRISRNEALPSPGSTLQQSDQPSPPKLLPAPVLLPTAFSARMMSRPQDLSSPPCSPDRGAQRESSEVFRTPALPRQRARTESRQLSSPPGSNERIRKRAYEDEDNLTSSAVRGKAAIGLLGLRQER